MIISSLLIVASIVGLMYQYTYTLFPRSAFREAMESVRTAANDFGRNGQELRIIHDNKLSYFPSYFYARDLAQVFLGDEPGSHNDTYAQASQEAIGLIPVADIQNAAVDAQAVAFVVFTETITEYQEMGLTEHPALGWLSENFNYLRTDRFGDLQIYYYVAKS